MSRLEPFRIDVPQAELDDLRDRLRRTRWAPQLDTGWERGVPQDVLRSLVERWADGYDWRVHEAALNAHPQFRTSIDGQTIHFLHARSTDPDATALLLTHGWPGSVVEFLDVLGPLTAPGPGACHVVAPHLPGYGFSTPLADASWTFDRVARAWVELMDRLGYGRFVVQGGDWGSLVSRLVADLAPEQVAGMHLNMLMQSLPRDFAAIDALESAALERLARYRREQRGYFLQQATRPGTLGAALSDSPVGQLAWIAEKFEAWTDPGSRFGGIEVDRVLTDVSLYWFTRSAASSAMSYWQSYHAPDELPVARVPTAVAAFPHEILPALRRVADADGHHIVRWTEFAHGGHFAAAEQPAAFAADVREFVASLS